MHCPFCHNPDSRVVDTRIADDGASIRRRRECTACKRRFTTLETSTFQVVKRSGAVEPFSRDKVISGVRKACHGRPVSPHELAVLAQQVEETLRSTGVSSVSSEEVGKAILPYLSELDEIAYLRFASVYRGFKSLDDFEEAIARLRARDDAQRRDPATSAGPGAGPTRSVAPTAPSGARRAQSAAGDARTTDAPVSEVPVTDAPVSDVPGPQGPTPRAAQERETTHAAHGRSRRRSHAKATVPEDAPTLLDG